jgi:hypothetical protein
VNSPIVDQHYVAWLTAQTQHWRVEWAGQPSSIARWLEPAVAHPTDPGQWRKDATWEIVRQAVYGHHQLADRLEAWAWPSCQAWWTHHGGPTWDPYSLAVAIAIRASTQWQAVFADLLHHPIQPGLALWAYGVWRTRPQWSDLNLTGLPAMVALDSALRAAQPPFAELGSPWGMVWQDWVNAPPPEETDPVPAGRYPTSLVNLWTQSLAKTDTTSLAPPVKSIKIRWF